MSEARKATREEIDRAIGTAIQAAIEGIEGGSDITLDLVDVVECLVTFAGESMEEFIPLDERIPILVQTIQCLRMAAGVTNDEVKRLLSKHERARTERTH